MRKIIYAMKEIRKSQLADMKVPQTRIQECEDKFAYLDAHLSGIKDQVDERLAEVMTSADFTYAIMEFVQRQMVPGYQRMEFPFEPLVWQDSVPNFLPVNRYQKRAGVDDLEYVGEKSQARPGSVVDATKRQYQVYRWEKQYDFSYEALMNDDLGYFQDQADLMGQSARRTLEKFVSRMYTNAVSIAALTVLGALYSTTGRLTSARISAARMGFGQRTDARGEPIEAELAFIVYHRGLEDTVRTIQASQLVPELATNAANVVRTGWTGIKDPHMAGTAPNLPWWGFTNHTANNIRPFVLARLSGRPAPLILRKDVDSVVVSSLLGGGRPAEPILGDFETGDIILKVSDVWGTYIGGSGNGNYFDVRGGYYSSGTAP
ncbi:MAG: hypothetical protein PVJ86_00015 [Phycisphaerales bacterium]|jgi:hypothetical protein